MGNLYYGSGQLESLSYGCEKEYIVAGRLEAIGQHRGPGGQAIIYYKGAAQYQIWQDQG